MASGAVVAKNVIPGGEDGVVGHPHYGDQVNLWLGNGYHDTYLYTADVVANAAERETYPPFPGCTEAAPGRCAAGGGSVTTDCVSEFFVDAPTDEKSIKRNSFTINDGGGTDFDGATNGTCVAHVMICLNNNDPGSWAAAASGSDVKTITIKNPKPDSRNDVDGRDRARSEHDPPVARGQQRDRPARQRHRVHHADRHAGPLRHGLSHGSDQERPPDPQDDPTSYRGQHRQGRRRLAQDRLRSVVGHTVIRMARAHASARAIVHTWRSRIDCGGAFSVAKRSVRAGLPRLVTPLDHPTEPTVLTAPLPGVRSGASAPLPPRSARASRLCPSIIVAATIGAPDS